MQIFCEGNQMNTQELLVDTNVLDKLVNDLGIESARKFMDSLDTEFQKRIENLRNAIEDRSYYQVAMEAHSLKSSAQISGAFKLAEILIAMEKQAKAEDSAVFELAQDAITTADLTRFAFLDVKLG